MTASRMLVGITGAVALFGLGAMIAGFALLGMLDPAGAQMANDHDPFGKPPSMMYDAVLLGVSGVFMTGAWLVARIAVHKKPGREEIPF